MILLLLITLTGCASEPAPDPDSMGRRWTDGVEQPKNMLEGWRCDLWRGHRDWPTSISCHSAVGEAEHTLDAGESQYRITGGHVWKPAGIEVGWECSEWRMGDTRRVAACYPTAQ